MLTTLALLIGFKYKDLNGSIIDLYHAHKWCQTFNCDIHIITDITEHGSDLELAIKQEIVDSDIRSFYNQISSKYILTNKDQFRSALHSILGSTLDKLVIYYTGHGFQNGIKLPDRSHMSFNDFRDDVLRHVPPEVEIFWILDCCNPTDMSLPYQLRNNKFMFQNSDTSYYGSHRILLITSANSQEKSITTKTGSLFTRYLFQILSNLSVTTFDIRKPLPLIHNRNLQRLIGNLSSAIRTVHSGYQQTVSIYTSYIHDPVLWMWIGSHKSYDIIGHYINDHPVIIVNRKI
jgi:hypothetical protein